MKRDIVCSVLLTKKMVATDTSSPSITKTPTTTKKKEHKLKINFLCYRPWKEEDENGGGGG